MKRAVLLLGPAFAALVGLALARAAPDPAATLPAGSAPLVLGDWVVFHAGFDAGLGADLAVGEAAPSSVAGAVRFERGRIGRAILLGAAGGGAELTYRAAGNLDLTRPGGASFWVATRAWQDADEPARGAYVPFLRVAGLAPTAFVLERDVRVRSVPHESIIAGVFELPGPRQHFLTLDAGPKWRTGDWHFVALSWDPTGFSVSLDGGPLTRSSVPGEALTQRFAGSETFLLGHHGAETWLLDDFTLYGRCLTAQDVAHVRNAARAASP